MVVRIKRRMGRYEILYLMDPLIFTAEITMLKNKTMNTFCGRNYNFK